MLPRLFFALIAFLPVVVVAAAGEPVRVAVAANFADTARLIAQGFERESGRPVILVAGSTGKLYAQIVNGAPFDAFFAADARRPQLLDEGGLAVRGSRFTYATGRLLLWSPEPGYIDSSAQVLAEGDFRHLAIANPRLAPYGKAAREVLEKLGLWGRLRGRMVRGENIGQTYQFVKSGNARLGFIAASQIMRPDGDPPGSHWLIPQSLYTPIEQQAVLLRDSPGARAFLAYARGEAAREIIRRFGYRIPADE
jgi:molybdate transport system substrate-binding protein